LCAKLIAETPGATEQRTHCNYFEVPNKRVNVRNHENRNGAKQGWVGVKSKLFFEKGSGGIMVQSIASWDIYLIVGTSE